MTSSPVQTGWDSDAVKGDGALDEAGAVLAQQVLGRALLGDGCGPSGQLIWSERTQRGKVGQQVMHLGVVSLALQDAIP